MEGYRVGALTEYLEKTGKVQVNEKNPLATMFSTAKKGSFNSPVKKSAGKLKGKKKLLKNTNKKLEEELKEEEIGEDSTSKLQKKAKKRLHADSEHGKFVVIDGNSLKKRRRVAEPNDEEDDADMEIDGDISTSPKVRKNKKRIKRDADRIKKFVKKPTTESSVASDIKPRDETSDKKTLFVGNLPNTVAKKEIDQLFKNYGEIISIRFRSAAVPDLKTSKKAAVIKKTFHENRQTINAYVQFSTEEAAQAALEMNGQVFKDLHLRVDCCSNTKNYNCKRSIFVGNLPYQIADEELWQYFSDCGEIEAVRVIRDAITGVGKGFGYILFKSADSVQLAIRLDEKPLQKRNIRVRQAVAKKNKPAAVKRDKVKNGIGALPKKTHGGPSFQGAIGVLQQKKPKKPKGMRDAKKGTKKFGKKKINGKPTVK